MSIRKESDRLVCEVNWALTGESGSVWLCSVKKTVHVFVCLCLCFLSVYLFLLVLFRLSLFSPFCVLPLPSPFFLLCSCPHLPSLFFFHCSVLPFFTPALVLSFLSFFVSSLFPCYLCPPSSSTCLSLSLSFPLFLVLRFFSIPFFSSLSSICMYTSHLHSAHLYTALVTDPPPHRVGSRCASKQSFTCHAR